MDLVVGVFRVGVSPFSESVWGQGCAVLQRRQAIIQEFASSRTHSLGLHAVGATRDRNPKPRTQDFIARLKAKALMALKSSSTCFSTG